MDGRRDLVGTMVGRYQVERLLAEGGMARVYIAVDTGVGRRVALKALLPELGSQPAIVERFMNEARAMGRIHHPGVVDVFDVMLAPTGELCIVMELINGRNLREHLAAYGPLPVAHAIPVMRGLADAIAAAHAQGIVHRDLKPENVLLVADPLGPRAKVLDFGIAKVVDAKNVKTATNTSMGTATYMAPEQFRSAKLVDARADIYALGCLFFELLTGRPPFGGRNLFEQMNAHLTMAPPLQQLPPGTPPHVVALIDRMLVKERDQRLASLTDAVAVLDGTAPLPPPGQSHSALPQASRTDVSPTAVVDVPGRGRAWIWATVAIVVVAIAVALALGLS